VGDVAQACKAPCLSGSFRASCVVKPRQSGDTQDAGAGRSPHARGEASRRAGCGKSARPVRRAGRGDELHTCSTAPLFDSTVRLITLSGRDRRGACAMTAPPRLSGIFGTASMPGGCSLFNGRWRMEPDDRRLRLAAASYPYRASTAVCHGTEPRRPAPAEAPRTAAVALGAPGWQFFARFPWLHSQNPSL
jgi:hypothetical protein